MRISLDEVRMIGNAVNDSIKLKINYIIYSAYLTWPTLISGVNFRQGIKALFGIECWVIKLGLQRQVIVCSSFALDGYIHVLYCHSYATLCIVPQQAFYIFIMIPDQDQVCTMAVNTFFKMSTNFVCSYVGLWACPCELQLCLHRDFCRKI